MGSIASVMQGTATSTIRVTTANGHVNDGIYLLPIGIRMAILVIRVKL
ncbi:hypothetical protein H9W95_08005 [Flavobacterium lindanitolerans]|nr:hypothetical protein [Flavobacterium lindanitolerans]